MSTFSVLVVEDNLDAGELLEDFLTHAGYQARLINRGDDAMKHLKEHHHPIILLDMHLPGVNGADLLKFIRGSELNKSSVVIAVSADYGMTDALDDDLDYVMLKPIDMDRLKQLLQRVQSSLSETINE